jgi:hypothetical protein
MNEERATDIQVTKARMMEGGSATMARVVTTLELTAMATR